MYRDNSIVNRHIVGVDTIHYSEQMMGTILQTMHTHPLYWGLQGEQGHLYEPLAVPEDVELRQRHVGGHLDRVVAAVPRVLQVGHRVAETL